MRFATYCLVAAVFMVGATAGSFDDDDIAGIEPQVENTVDMQPEVHVIERSEFPFKRQNTESVSSTFIRAANAAGSIPLASTFRMRERVLKLGKFCSDSRRYV